jgi:hypothetical protein
VPLPASTNTASLTADEAAVITAAVDKFPPLTQTAKARLAILLRGSRDSDAFTDKVRATLRGAR